MKVIQSYMWICLHHWAAFHVVCWCESWEIQTWRGCQHLDPSTPGLPIQRVYWTTCQNKFGWTSTILADSQYQHWETPQPFPPTDASSCQTFCRTPASYYRDTDWTREIHTHLSKIIVSNYIISFHFSILIYPLHS